MSGKVVQYVSTEDITLSKVKKMNLPSTSTFQHWVQMAVAEYPLAAAMSTFDEAQRVIRVCLPQPKRPGELETKEDMRLKHELQEFIFK